MGDDPPRAAPRERAEPEGLIFSLLTLPLRLFGVLCGALLLSILFECIGMHWFWKGESWHHAEHMLHFEMEQVSNHFTRSVVVREPLATTRALVARAYDLFFLRSGLVEKSRELAVGARRQADRAPGLLKAFDGFSAHLEAYALAAGYTVLTFLVRLMILALSSPLFGLWAFVGFVDGLVRRDKRRFVTAYESGFLYHRVRALIVPLAVLPWVIYLSMPVSVSPLLILLPSALLLSTAVNMTAASFKKYL